MKNRLICIVGPTASGKTSLGIEIAKHFNSNIISADSRQFFKEMPIGSAQPGKEELMAVKHHCIANLSIHEEMNVGKFEILGLEILENLFLKNPIQILVGGSGLYVQAICEGFDDLPEKNQELRDELQNDFNKFGIEILQKKLLQLDPQHYKIIDIQNPQRLMRAIEICILTGKSNSFSKVKKINKRNFETFKIGINLEREILYSRINLRVDQMMEMGLLEEVKKIIPYKHLAPLQSVGYKELFDYFDGEITLEQAVNLIKQHTRNFAKRQMTWFRRDPTIHWINEAILNKELLESLELSKS